MRSIPPKSPCHLHMVLMGPGPLSFAQSLGVVALTAIDLGLPLKGFIIIKKKIPFI